jgi:hypothetical protein
MSTGCGWSVGGGNRLARVPERGGVPVSTPAPSLQDRTSACMTSLEKQQRCTIRARQRGKQQCTSSPWSGVRNASSPCLDPAAAAARTAHARKPKRAVALWHLLLHKDHKHAVSPPLAPARGPPPPRARPPPPPHTLPPPHGVLSELYRFPDGQISRAPYREHGLYSLSPPCRFVFFIPPSGGYLLFNATLLRSFVARRQEECKAIVWLASSRHAREVAVPRRCRFGSWRVVRRRGLFFSFCQRQWSGTFGASETPSLR